MEFVSVSEVTSYAYCPRYCYFIQRYGESYGRGMALKEIYLSIRKGLDAEWAKARFLSLGGDEGIFSSAIEDFRFNGSLNELVPVDWEVSLTNEKFRLKGVVDEIVTKNEMLYPLSISYKAPERGVWFKDRVKITCFCILLEEKLKDKVKRGFVYYCRDGRLRDVEISRKDRMTVLRMIERVIRLRKNFIPERKESGKCKFCSFRENCLTMKTSFASKFL
ncbi:CRISPR-associated protein Cas4 [Archaeoglobus sulfaticallidus PM70-1]|uniref:CRISPR-associated exonuclease Cas4 n=1 Tax=Archaeoglobus sulfaticallidus PM70-1 TaxID=387631 RepID=N0BCF9_9EURY|nr:CRISPR-associated protein Cas4 [Archaeoglobus sulfaticallidus]AGK60683.1 CRISPR-associated protein Cas4 [Archaeoglobus sulfaticallidus PM70-1]